jgi:hypothetical protein
MEHDIDEKTFFNLIAPAIDCYGAFSTETMLDNLKQNGYFIKKPVILQPTSDKLPPAPDYIL